MQKVLPLSISEIREEIFVECAFSGGGESANNYLPPPMSILALDGAAFVEAAFLTYLGKLPDSAEFAYFSHAIVDGIDKLSLIDRLQNMPSRL